MMPTTFRLIRQVQNPHSTWGVWLGADGNEICKILERGETTDHPRVPAGIYKLEMRPVGASHFDDAFKDLLSGICPYHGILWLPVVPGRTFIEVHTANFVDQLLGCLASGMEIARDENGDFMIQGGTSRPAYQKLYPAVSAAILAGDTFLNIKDVQS